MIDCRIRQMKALRGDGYSAIREAKGVVDNINLLEKKVWDCF
jgi:hypothetical protein